MNFGRKLRAVIVGMSCLSLLAQTTPSIAAPPVKVKPVSATSKPANTSGTVQLGDLSGAGLKPGVAGPTTNETGLGRSPNLRTGTSGKATLNPNKAVPPSAIDVALATDGVITGRVLDSKQCGVANAPVVIRQGPEEMARTFTDADGHFQIRQMKSGVYLLSSNNGYGLFRFWTKPTAPPAARSEVLLVSEAVVVRAQNANCDSGDVLYDENGQPYAQIHVVDNGQICDENCPPVGSGGLCCLDCCSLLILGLTAAALTVGIIILLDDDPASP